MLSPCYASQSPTKPLIDLIADVYAILQTGKFLQTQFDQAKISAEFYFKRMKHFHSELVALQTELTHRGKTLLDFAKKGTFAPEFEPVLRLIGSFDMIQYDRKSREWELDPFQLAAVVTEITSQFITIIDYCRIIPRLDESLLLQLLHELQTGLQKFTVLYPIYAQVRLFIQEITSRLPEYQALITTDPDQNALILRQIEDRIFQIYTEFQRFLALPE
jgi:hypothetical protein